MFDDIRKCRDCKEIGDTSEMVKYGTRHYLHAICAAKRGIDFVANLPTWMQNRVHEFAAKESSK